MKYTGYRTLKTAIGVAASIYIAAYLNLNNATAAGIITILSLQSTRRQSLHFAGKMFGAFLLSLGVSSGVFYVFGYSPLSFGAFILLFIPLATKFQLQKGIVVSAVLTTHLLLEKTIAAALIYNQLSLMAVGVLVALFLNLFMPNFESVLKEEQRHIERLFKKILLDIANSLKNEALALENEKLFSVVQARLESGRNIAYMDYNNNFFLSKREYTKYMALRLRQLECLHQMKRDFERLSVTYKQTIIVAEFMIHIADSIGKADGSSDPIADLRKLRERFTKMDLPQDRKEFENRSVLYQLVNDMEEFLFLETVFKHP